MAEPKTQHNVSFSSSVNTVESDGPSERGRSSRKKDITFVRVAERSASNNRNHEMFFPKSSHIHVPHRNTREGNCDKITRFASPTRHQVETEVITRVPQSYLTSLSAVVSSKKVVKRRASNDTQDPDANDQNVSFASSSSNKSCESDQTPAVDYWDGRRGQKKYQSMPHTIMTERLHALNKKTQEIVKDRKQRQKEFQKELYDIRVGKAYDRDRQISHSISTESSPYRTPVSGSAACSRELLCSPAHVSNKTPPDTSNHRRDIPTPPLSSTPNSNASSNARRQFFSSTPEMAASKIYQSSSAVGRASNKSSSLDAVVATPVDKTAITGSGNSVSSVGAKDPRIKVVVTTEHCVDKKTDYYRLRDRYDPAEVESDATTRAMNDMRLTSDDRLKTPTTNNVANNHSTDSDHPPHQQQQQRAQSPNSNNKKSLSATISNFIRKMSPHLRRKGGKNAASETSDSKKDDVVSAKATESDCSSSVSIGSSQSGSPARSNSSSSNKPSRGKKSPLSSPIRKLIPTGKRSTASSDSATVITTASDKKPATSTDSSSSSEKLNTSADSATKLMLKSIGDNAAADKNVYSHFKEKHRSSPTEMKQQQQSQQLSSPLRATDQSTSHQQTGAAMTAAVNCGAATGKPPPHSLNVRNVSVMTKKLVHSNISTESIGDCSLDINMMGSEPSIGSGQSGHHSSSISKRSLLSQDNLTYGSTTKPSNGTAVNAERKSTSESEISSMTAPKPIQKQPVSNKSSNSNTDVDGAADDDNSKYADNNNKFVNSKKGGADDVVDNCTPNDIQIESILNRADIVKKQTTVYSNGAVTRTVVGATTDEDDVFPSVHRRRGSSCGAKQNVVNAVDNESTDIFPDNRDAVIATSARKAAIVVPLAKRKDSMVGKTDSSPAVHDGHYFIALTNKQRELITARSDKVEAYLQSDNINEEASGKIRAAIGKAHLLMSQKFKQFLGLCDDNLHPKEDGPTTTIQDLAGFWDLVLIQIDDVESNFDEIEEMKKVGWNEVDETQFKKRTSSCSSQKSVNGTETPEPKTPTRTRMPKRQMKPKTPAEKAREETARKTREEARRRLMQAKREARKRLLSGEHGDKEVEIFVPETTS